MLLLSVFARLPELLDLSFVVNVFAKTFFQLILVLFYITTLGEESAWHEQVRDSRDGLITAD